MRIKCRPMRHFDFQYKISGGGCGAAGPFSDRWSATWNGWADGLLTRVFEVWESTAKSWWGPSQFIDIYQKVMGIKEWEQSIILLPRNDTFAGTQIWDNFFLFDNVHVVSFSSFYRTQILLFFISICK